MGDINVIRACLENFLKATSGIPEVVVPNKKYDPDPAVSFVRAQFVPLSRRPANVGTNPLVRSEGLYVLNVHTAEYGGEGTGFQIGDLIISRFKPSTAIVHLGQEVGISYSEAGMPYSDAPFYITPITIGWYAYSQS